MKKVWDFLDPADIDDGSFDNCSQELTFSLDRSEFTCDDVGEQDIQMDVIDDFGNQNICQVSVNVIESGACNGVDCVKNPKRAGFWFKQCLAVDDDKRRPRTEAPWVHRYHKKREQQSFPPEIIENVGEHLDDLFGQSGLGACQDGMRLDSKYDNCDRAFRQLTTLLFNLELKRLTKVCPICLKKPSTQARTIGELVPEIAGYIKEGKCSKALKIASKINRVVGLTANSHDLGSGILTEPLFSMFFHSDFIQRHS